MLFQAGALIWRARCSQESWMVIRSLVHATTGSTMFEQVSFSMHLKLVLQITPQNPKTAKCSSALNKKTINKLSHIYKGDHEES
ncbi:MAG: hypothetical protein P4L27_09905 [Ignavibacteriaceae bacterium]|nr:hypothetical protein [Ignavibacteriaceae bacterium]